MIINKHKLNFFLKTHLASFTALLFMVACTGTYTPTKYSIKQFYQNNRIGGGTFSNDELMLQCRTASRLFRLKVL